MSKEAPDPVYVFRGAKSPVTSLTFLKDAKDGDIRYLAAGTQEGQLLTWDLKTKCIVKDWVAHSGSAILWLHSESADELWTLGRHDRVICWNMNPSSPQVLSEYSLSDYLGFSQCHIISYGVKLLAIPGPSQEGVTVYDIESQAKLCSLTPKDPKKYGTLMQMRWVKDSTNPYLLVAYESGHLSLWDYNMCKVISEIQFTENPICLSYDSVSQTGVVGSSSEKIFTFYIDNEKTLSSKNEVIITNPGVSSCISRPDGKIYVTGGWDSRIRLFASKKMKPLAVLMYHKKTVECLAYSTSYVKYFECEYLLAAGSADKSVSLWNLFNQ